jgi:hypothetical protein
MVMSIMTVTYAGQKKMSHAVQLQRIALASNTIQSQPRTSIHILAAMVEFQKDSVSQTSGDGKFMSIPVYTMIDPAPHDTSYFRNKIKFVANYFQRASKGRLSITGDIVSGITLTKKMSEYSPPTNSTDNKKLVQLATETWQAVSDSFPALNFSQYDAFVVFHAGCGRDIDLVSLLGYDPTPYDIPSLYLDSTAFAKALNMPTFGGIAVRGGNIQATMILPETETRIFSTSLGNDTLQLSTNGLFAASIGSYLGLPDLFNTKTGASGIGQFGLMDGASFFAYSGVFPPEPSAWEKIYLGWTTPIVLSSNSTNILLPAVGSFRTGQDTIYKIPITSSEYFLVENRNRDSKQNGQHIKSVLGNDTLNFSFSKDTAGFNYSEIYDLKGSIIDVEDYDWALIGYHEDSTTQYDGGGILIWHIDENVIATNLVTNTVNANADHRGVNLEEADGSQDIGQSYQSLTAGSGTEYGSPLDCWFAENHATVYRNSFDQTTFPNSKSYSGASSLVAIKDFSPRSARMTMTVKFDTLTSFKRLTNFTHTLTTTTQTGFPTTTSSAVILPVDNRVYIWGNDGKSKVSDTTGLFSNVGGQLGIAAYEVSSSQMKLAGVQDTLLYIWTVTMSNGTQTITVDTVHLGTKATTTPMFATSPLSLYVGGTSGKLYQYQLGTKLLTVKTFGISDITAISQLPGAIMCVNGSSLYNGTPLVTLPTGASSWLLASAVSTGGNYVVVAQQNGNRVLAYDQTLSKMFDVQLNNAMIHSLAMGDIDGDGEKDIIITSSKNIYALNRHGVMLDNFPITVSRDSQFVGAPVLGDIDGDGAADILVLASDGTLSAWNNHGKLLADYPVMAASPGTASLAALKDSAGHLAVFTATRTGYTQALSLGHPYNATKLYWTQQFGNAMLSSADSTILAVTPTSTSELLLKSRTYNWPNPVYGNSTQIRYYVNENATVNIKIFDLAGSKITELSGNGIAGFDNEVTWNVANIQSGIYLARVEAKSANQSSVAIVKIAVVK